MASSASTTAKIICLFMIMGLTVVPTTMASTDYYVCDALGWTPGAISTIGPWLFGKRFIVNDVVHFVSILPLLPVYRVTAEAYDNCDARAALFTDLSGNCAYKLTEPGTYYFISSFVECTLGLKIAIDVHSA